MATIRKYLIASHGRLSSGVKSSLDIIVGYLDNVFIIEAYVAENRPFEADINDVINSLSGEDELIIFTDLLGGSITNQLAKFALQDRIHLISGFNLPLIIEVILADTNSPLDEVIEAAIDRAREQIVYVNHLIKGNKENSKND